MPDTVPVAVNTFLAVPDPTSVVNVDYTANTVPDDIKNKVIESGVLFVDVVNAGAQVGTGLIVDEATDRGSIKNHWKFRAHPDLGQDGQQEIGQVQFGMDVMPALDIGSNEGQYARSSRSDPGSPSDLSFSPVGSIIKPPASSSDEGGPAALPLFPATGEGSHDLHDSQSFVASDIENVGRPPDITSSDGRRFQQPIEGAPYPGDFNVKVRGRTEPSRSIVIVFKLRLAPGTTFGKLLDALTHRNMEPFFFRKVGFAYLGCQDFISQAILAWLSDGFLVSAEATPVLSDGAAGDIHIDDKDIRSLLGWRWTNPWSRTASPAGSGAVLTASPTVSTAQSGLLPSSTLSTINSSTTRSSQTPPLDSGLRCVAKDFAASFSPFLHMTWP